MQAFDSIAKTRTKFRRVDALPPGAERWRIRLILILRASAPARDMSDAEMVAVTVRFNGDPDVLDLDHWHAPGCTCGIETLEQARERSKQLLRTMFEAGLVVPLLYRFKHFTEANAYAQRGIGFHDVLPSALDIVYPKKVRDQAQQEVDQLGGPEGGGAGVSFAKKQAVRANPTLKFFSEAKRCDLTFQAHV